MFRQAVLAPMLAVVLLTMVVAIASAQSLQVMTWNIRYDNPGDGENRWRNRRDWMAEIILREKTDIAGFQEVLSGQLDDLKQRLPDMAAYGVGRDDGKSAGEMAPIFYRQSRFELLEQGSFWLSTTPDKPGSKGWDAALPRVTSWLKLKDKQTQATFYVLNAHFDHRGTEARRRSAELIVERVRSQFAAHPVLSMGDLNSVPDSPAYEALAAKVRGKALLRDAYEHAAKKAGPDSTWNGFQKIVPGSRIDYLFATESIKLHGLRTLTDQRDGRFPSDHLPVVVELEIR